MQSHSHRTNAETSPRSVTSMLKHVCARNPRRKLARPLATAEAFQGSSSGVNHAHSRRNKPPAFSCATRTRRDSFDDSLLGANNTIYHRFSLPPWLYVGVTTVASTVRAPRQAAKDIANRASMLQEIS